MSATSSTPAATIPHRTAPALIAAAVDTFPAGRDAAVLGAELAAVSGGELMLVTVHPDPMIVVPEQAGWSAMHSQSRSMLAAIRDELAPRARIAVETDFSVAHALERVAARDHRDLLVVGSSREAAEGRVRIGKRARQLLNHASTPLAIAPRGLHARGPLRLARIGVGYNGTAESAEALAYAAAIAAAAGSGLHIRGVVDDRIPGAGLTPISPPVLAGWEEMIEAEIAAMQGRCDDAARRCGVAADVSIERGRPASALLALSDEVDLLVIGSRHWGPVARLLLGSTGEALVRDARASLLIVPRPHAS